MAELNILITNEDEGVVHLFPISLEIVKSSERFLKEMGRYYYIPDDEFELNYKNIIYYIIQKFKVKIKLITLDQVFDPSKIYLALEIPTLGNVSKSDVFLFEEDDPINSIKKIKELLSYKSLLPDYLGNMIDYMNESVQLEDTIYIELQEDLFNYLESINYHLFIIKQS